MTHPQSPSAEAIVIVAEMRERNKRNDFLTDWWRDKLDALAASLVSPPKAEAGEPVEWRYLQCGKGGWKHVYSQESVKKLHDDNLRLPKRRRHVIEPLYLAPPAAPNHEARGDGVRVTDEMVERACPAVCADTSFGGIGWDDVLWLIRYEADPIKRSIAEQKRDRVRRIARAALEAALPPLQTAGGEVSSEKPVQRQLGDGRAEIIEACAAIAKYGMERAQRDYGTASPGSHAYRMAEEIYEAIMKLTSNDVRPCRCGSSDITVFANDGWIGVECNNCDNATPRCDRSEHDAVTRWNDRYAAALSLEQGEKP
jgi:hypothetical protein